MIHMQLWNTTGVKTFNQEYRQIHFHLRLHRGQYQENTHQTIQLLCLDFQMESHPHIKLRQQFPSGVQQSEESQTVFSFLSPRRPIYDLSYKGLVTSYSVGISVQIPNSCRITGTSFNRRVISNWITQKGGL